MIEENNQVFAIKIEHLHYITKNKNEATSFVHIDSHAETGVKIIKEIQDPNNTHKFSMKNAIKEIDKRLRKEEIDFKMNAHKFNLFNVYYGIKENPRLCYIHTTNIFIFDASYRIHCKRNKEGSTQYY